MSNPEHVDECYTLPPCESNYTPKGSLTKLDDGMDVYLVGDKGSSKGIVFQYDIFGMHPCSQQVADLLAAQGFRVAIPGKLP